MILFFSKYVLLVIGVCLLPVVSPLESKEREFNGCEFVSTAPCIWFESQCKWLFGATTYQCTNVPRNSKINVQSWTNEGDYFSMALLDSVNFANFENGDPFVCLNSNCNAIGNSVKKYSGLAPFFDNFTLVLQSFNAVQRANISTTMTIQR